MTVYFVVNATVVDQDKLNEYNATVGPTLAGIDVKILAVTSDATAIEGTPKGPRMVILEFPDEAEFRKWYDRPEYQTPLGLRLAATDGFAVLAQGL
jgi:uncharacterized protein (DUF1330 family)